MLEHVAEILEAARLAPSRDNLQPWRFIVDGETVSFLVDAERDRSPMNAGDRMARIAVGAALESALIRAARMGATAKIQEPRPGALVSVTFTGAKRVPQLDKRLERRATNRHEYDGRAVDDETFKLLRDATPALETTRAHWFGRERVRVLAPLVADATALLLANGPTRAATVAAVRFDARDRDEVAHGLSVGSLELSGPERVTFAEMQRASGEFLTATGAFRKLAARERRLMESASGVCLVSASGEDPMADVNAGRTLLRTWLALTQRGLAAQPVAAIAAVEALLARDDGYALSVEEMASARAISDAQRAAVPSLERGARVAIALRFGWTSRVATRVGRRALKESVSDESSPPGPTAEG